MASMPTDPGTVPMEKTVVGSLPGASQLDLVGRHLLIHRAARLASLGGNALLFGAAGSGRTAVLHAVAGELGARGSDVRFVDGAGVEDAVELLTLVRRSCGLGTGQGASAPFMLVDLRPDPAVRQQVIAIDDLEIPACQELFGRWRRHLWRLGACWVATAEAGDPTPYLDAGADGWWEDGVLAVPPLDARQSLELCRRTLQDVGFGEDVPDNLVAGAGGNPRELRRRVRAMLVDHEGAPVEDADHVGRDPWSTAEAPAVEELSGGRDEAGEQHRSRCVLQPERPRLPGGSGLVLRQGPSAGERARPPRRARAGSGAGRGGPSARGVLGGGGRRRRAAGSASGPRSPPGLDAGQVVPSPQNHTAAVSWWHGRACGPRGGPGIRSRSVSARSGSDPAPARDVGRGHTELHPRA